MSRVQVTFTEAETIALRERAEETGRPVTSLVREVVNVWLAEAERERRWDRALQAIGGCHSGLHDVAENHDEYIGQAIEEHLGLR